MAPVYSEQFIAYGGFSGVGLYAWTTPAGFVAVVKSMTITVGSNATPGNGFIRHQPSNAVIHSSSVHITDLPTVDYQAYSQFGTWCLQPGESLEICTTGGWIADFFASGYLLKQP